MIFLFSLVASITLRAADIHVTATEVPSDKGSLQFVLYSTEQTYLSEAQEFLEEHVPVQMGISKFTITNIPPGEYALIIFHDENGNGVHDKNFLGIPIEKFGISGITKKLWSKPSWAEIKFPVADNQANDVTILLKWQ